MLRWPSAEDGEGEAGLDENLLLSFEAAEDAHWWFAGRRGIVLDALAAAVPSGDARTLEVGCGTGGFLADLGSRYPGIDAVGVEPCEAAAEAAGRRGCRVVVGSFERLPAEDGDIDLLVALDVLEHCADEQVALGEAMRVLTPGGALLLTVPALPALWSSHDDVNGHHRRYTAKTLSEAVALGGFAIERKTYFNSLLLPGAALVRLTARAAGSSGAVGTDMPSRPLNSVLTRVFSAERALLRVADLPLGLSLLLVARKPAEVA